MQSEDTDEIVRKVFDGEYERWRKRTDAVCKALLNLDTESKNIVSEMAGGTEIRIPLNYADKKTKDDVL